MTWHLHGSGRRPRSGWDVLASLGSTWWAAWADHHGFHLRPGMPAELPRTTHVWAWAERRWLRVRVDHDHWWAALLTEGGEIGGEPWCRSEPIEAPDITTFRNWGAHRNIRQYRPADENAEQLLERTDMIQLVPLLPSTATFIGDLQSRSPEGN